MSNIEKMLESELDIEAVDPVASTNPVSSSDPVAPLAPLGGAVSRPRDQHVPRQLYGRDVNSMYADLRRILDNAYDQSAKGKGAQRHAVGPVGDRPWDQQPILQIGRMVGPGYSAGQIQKKVQEACGMIDRKDFNAAKSEVLGAIVYAAAMYRLIEDMERVQ